MPKSRCSNVTAFLLEKVSKGKVSEGKGESCEFRGTRCEL